MVGLITFVALDDAGQCMRVSQALEAGTVSVNVFKSSRSVGSLKGPRFFHRCG